MDDGRRAIAIAIAIAFSIREDRKMTREQFIGNNRAIDTALTPQYLGAIFDRICSNEIKMDSIDTDDQSSIICYTNPLKHGYLEKKGPGGLGKGAYKRRWFVLKNKLLYYLEEPPALGKRPQLRGFIPIVREKQLCTYLSSGSVRRQIICMGVDHVNVSLSVLESSFVRPRLTRVLLLGFHCGG
jgi:hypothetical protein